jgi:hypothetical protein
MKGPWIYLRPDEIDLKESEAERGVQLQSSLSPYDIPEQLRGYYSEFLKRFVIEFRYMTDESLVERKLSDHVTIKEGKNSGRLYDILVDVEAPNVHRITEAIREAKLHIGETKRKRLNARLFDAVQEHLTPMLLAYA